MGRHGRGVVRAFAPQGRRRAVGRPADEPLSHVHRRRTCLERRPQTRCRSLDVDPGILVALLGEQAPPHVDPGVRHARIIEILGDDRGRHQLAVGDDGVVPQLGILRPVDRLARDRLQLPEERLDPIEPFRSVPQLADDRRMVFAQFADRGQRRRPIAPLQPAEDPLQRVGRLAHRRYDDEQVAFVVDDFAQVAHPFGIAHRGAAELVYLHLAFVSLTPAVHGRPAAPRAAATGARRALRCSGTGTHRRPPPRRSASRWVCRRRAPPSTRCGSGPGRRPPGSAASAPRT